MSAKPAPRPTRIIRAGGALVWRFNDSQAESKGQAPTENNIEVLLVHRPRYGDWSWPKGKAEPGEHILAAAVREVEEETQVPVTLGAPLLTQRYRLGSGQTKEVYYWVGRVLEDREVLAARPNVQIASAREIDEVRWVSPAKARRLLTRRGDRRLLDDLVLRAAEGKLDTRTLVLMRHAKAVSRERWKGEENTRPLERSGMAHALDSMELLNCFGVSVGITSEWERCRRTLAPYFAVINRELTTTAELTEESYHREPARFSEDWDRRLRKLRHHTAVCMHRPTQRLLVDGVKKYAPALVLRDSTDLETDLRSGGMLVFHLARSQNGADPVLVATERHRAPRPLC